MYGKSVEFIWQINRLCSVRHYSKRNFKSLLDVLAKMPKTNLPSAGSRRTPNIIQKYDKKGPPSNVYLQVIGSGACGAPNALYLFTDHNRYLFNCGESTQRIALEHKVKVSRLDHIFITNKTWKNLGGLPGLSITLQQVGASELTLHGPEGLDVLYNATKGFVVMKEMNVNIAKCTNSNDYDDNCIHVKYMVLHNTKENVIEDLLPDAKKPKLLTTAQKDYQEFIKDDTDYYNRTDVVTDSDAKRKCPNSSKAKPKFKEPDNVKTRNEKVLANLQNMNNCSIAYVCTLKKRLGSLNLEKCVELGVKPGPLLGKLKNGQDVVLPNGNLVKSADVKTPDDPGPVFIVLEVLDISYLTESKFNAYFDDGSNPPQNIPVLVVHFTPSHVFRNPTYQAFIAMFGPTTRHLVLNEQNSCLGSEAVHRMQHKLHSLDPEIFPLLRDVSIPAVWNTQLNADKADNQSEVDVKGLEELKNKIALAQFQNIINLESLCNRDAGHDIGDRERNDKVDTVAGKTLTMFHLRPRRLLGFDNSVEPKLYIQNYIKETMDVDGFVDTLQRFRRKVEQLRIGSSTKSEYPKVIFLGTGSSMPGKTRNVSAIVLYISESRSMLLDCGEGTHSQIVRFYGQKRANHFLRTLRSIYISHLHADHHLGLLGVLQARRRAFLEAGLEPEALYLLAPGQIMAWLAIYDKHFESILDHFTLVPNQNLTDVDNMHKPENASDMTPAMLAHMGLKNIKTCYVAHCPNAFGVAVHIGNEHKITYSGDTIPCQELVAIGQDSSLLIHEATMEDELAQDARAKMHSTTSQAMEVGRQMGARYTVLTHFSQRYARIPRLVQHQLEDNCSVGIAYDNMQITMNDLDILPHMYAPLQLMFAEHCLEIEAKAELRQRHIERMNSALTPPPTDIKLEVAIPVQKPQVSKPVPKSPVHKSPMRTYSRCSYRESHSSRLRQEQIMLKISNGLRVARSRSASVSNRSRSSIHRCTGSTTKCLNDATNVVEMQTPHKPSPLFYSHLKRQNVKNQAHTLCHGISTTSNALKDRSHVSARPVKDNTSTAIINNQQSKADTHKSETSKEVLEIMSHIQKSRLQKDANGKVNSFGTPFKIPIIRRDIVGPIIKPGQNQNATPVHKISCVSTKPITWSNIHFEDDNLDGLKQKVKSSFSKTPTKGSVCERKLRESKYSGLLQSQQYVKKCVHNTSLHATSIKSLKESCQKYGKPADVVYSKNLNSKDSKSTNSLKGKSHNVAILNKWNNSTHCSNYYSNIYSDRLRNSKLQNKATSKHNSSQLTVAKHNSSQLTVARHNSSQLRVAKHNSSQSRVAKENSSQLRVAKHNSSQLRVAKDNSSQLTVNSRSTTASRTRVVKRNERDIKEKEPNRSAKSKTIVTENLMQSIEKHVNRLNKNNNNNLLVIVPTFSNKMFIPQLEDIKSSFLILNKNQNSRCNDIKDDDHDNLDNHKRCTHPVASNDTTFKTVKKLSTAPSTCSLKFGTATDVLVTPSNSAFSTDTNDCNVPDTPNTSSENIERIRATLNVPVTTDTVSNKPMSRTLIFGPASPITAIQNKLETPDAFKQNPETSRPNTPIEVSVLHNSITPIVPHGINITRHSSPNPSKNPVTHSSNSNFISNITKSPRTNAQIQHPYSGKSFRSANNNCIKSRVTMNKYIAPKTDHRSSYAARTTINYWTQNPNSNSLSKYTTISRGERDMLNEIKQKFKSKEYQRDSKYEKIEGLNWISWN